MIIMPSFNLSIRPSLSATALLLASLSSGLALLGDDQAGYSQLETALRAPMESADNRKYAPDKGMEVKNLAIDITPDFKQRTIHGAVTLVFKPIARPLRQLPLDAVDLTIASVKSSEQLQGWQHLNDKLTLTFAEPVPVDREVTITVDYSGQPVQGFYFRTPEMGYLPGDSHFFTQGEAIEARHWYPCFDAPNAKFTSEVTCHVPEDMTVISNGRQVSEIKEEAGLKAVRWVQDKPHTSYLIALTAGYFKKIEGMHRDVPLSFYTPASQIEHAASSFAGTSDMMEFFEKETGVNYPWAKYAQVCVNDFVAGGMENTSLTILTDGTLFPQETENIRSSVGLVAHELAHQWFGDLVTCKDWSHLWLNEGFATYYAHLYEGHKFGHEEYLYGLYGDAQGILGQANDTKSIVYRKFDAPMEQFSYLAYPKGSWVLHMLRSQLGDELYRRCIKTYLERHKFGNVITEDLNAVIEELSGRSFDQFFDQWVYHAHHPELEINYAWEEPARLARVTVKQVQALSEQVMLFRFPLTLRFKVAGTTIDREIVVKEKEEDFSFPLAKAPEVVRVDPAYTLLAKVKFNIPDAMLKPMLADSEDVIGRVLAVAQCSGRSDHESIQLLKDTLNQDPYYGLRLDASRGLRAAHTDEARDALLASTTQSDARVRRQVWGDLRGFYHESVLASAQKALETERNPDILVELIGTLGAYPQTSTREALITFLSSKSFRNELAGEAIATLRAQENPAAVTPVYETLTKREKEFTTGTFARGLSALAGLARNDDNKDTVREFLLRQLNHPKRYIRETAINALGTLADPRAIAALQPFTRAAKDNPERSAAERAVASLRASRKPVDDYQDIRSEVLGLQKENRDLRKDLDALKKQVGELTPKLAAEQTKDSAPKKKKK